MVDYKRLADDDVGGDLDTAFTTMSAMTVATTPEVMVTYRRVAASVSLSASAELETNLIAATTIPSWVDKALANGGININDPQTSEVLATLVSAENATAINAMGVITEPKYQGFKIGHLANARQMRLEGRV